MSSLLRNFILAAAWSFTVAQSCFAQPPLVSKVPTPAALHPLPFYAGGRMRVDEDSTLRDFGGRRLVYQWPGTYFIARFQGSEAYFQLGSGKQLLYLRIDDQDASPLIQPEAGVYRISGLSAGNHTVRIQVVSESQDHTISFDGFALPATGVALPAPHQNRQIEFIGDSHTVGYGNISATRTCSKDELWAATDNSKAFGPLTAAHYGADYQVNAISGHGIVRNYDGSPGDPVPIAYPYTLLDKAKLYSDPLWHPQVIVIALGTNAFATPLHASERWKSRDELHADYEATYVRFVESIRMRNPHPLLILWATDGSSGEIQAEVQKVVSTLKRNGETRIAFIPMNGLSMTGCHWHPSVKDDESISNRLINLIDQHPEVWQ